MTQRFRAGFIAAVLGLASFAPLSHAMANDTIDPVTTGAVQPDASAVVAAAEVRGSQAFRDALAELVDGDAAAAYAQAAELDGDVERRTIQWAAIYYNAGKIDYAAIKSFAAD